MNVVNFVELAKRAVQCQGWVWMRGMSVISDTDHDAVVWHDTSIMYVDQDDMTGSAYIDDADLPDLTDPATLGCLLHLVREHWGDHGAHTRKLYRYCGSDFWLCCAPSVADATRQTDGATEAEALVKALEMEMQKND